MNSHFFRARRLAGLLLLAGFAAASGHAQNAKAEQARAVSLLRQTAREEAFEAFKAGDSATGLAKLTANITRDRKARDPDLQVADQLAEIASRFRNAGDHARASEAVGLAVAKISTGRSRVSSRESARALVQAAELYDHVLGNGAHAQTLYEQALALDPELKLVAERLAHLKAVAKRAVEKTTANDLLRRRAAEEKR